MTLIAKDVMIQKFDKIHSHAPAKLAIEMILNGKVRSTGHKTVSLLVVDESSELAGVITMFDILYHLRPSFLNYFGIKGEDLTWDGQLQSLIKELGSKKVHQLMSSNVVSAAPDEHLMVLLDRMVKNKYRRLPVVENQRPIGMVYISEIYHYLFSNFEL